jgi:ubiquinone/menaquinone biosynthesis C-methylase UbiE
MKINQMNKEKNIKVCPVERAGGLDNSLRRLLQNPHKIVSPYINKGMTVLDLGCGPGVFTTEIAKMLDDTGKVIAADLQDGMLAKVSGKIKGTELEKKIELHKCSTESIDVKEQVDFVLAFYMIHEVPDQERIFNELKSLLKPNGRILIVEPKFHVSKKSFEFMVQRMESIGFKTAERPKVFFSRTAIFELKNKLL